MSGEPSAPNPGQRPDLITEVPGHLLPKPPDEIPEHASQDAALPFPTDRVYEPKHPRDPSLSNLQIANMQQDPRYGLESVNVRTERRNAHNEAMNYTAGVRAIEAQARPYEPEDSLVFKLEDTHVANPLDFDFMANGLPMVPEDLEPLAVVVSHEGNPETITSVMLLAKNPTYSGVELLFLEDETFRPEHEAQDYSPKWHFGGSAHLTAQHYHAEVLPGDNSSLVFRLGRSDIVPATVIPPRLSILRAQPTADEAKLADIETIDKRFNRARRVGKALATMAMVAGLSMMQNPLSALEPGPEKTFEGELKKQDHISASEQRVLDNRQLFREGNIAALDEIIAKSAFAKPIFEQAQIDRISQASTMENLEGGMNDVLAPRDIVVSIPKGSSDEFTGFKPEEFQMARSRALGILDGFNNLGFVPDSQVSGNYSADKKMHIYIVESAFSDAHVRGDKVDGFYDADYRTGPRLVIGGGDNADQARAAEITEHEIAHHVDSSNARQEHRDGDLMTLGSIGQEVAVLLPKDFRFGKKGQGSGEVGSTIPTEYAGTNYQELAAELVATAFGDNNQVDANQKTLVQEQYSAMLAELEESYPGVSAYVYKKSLETKSRPLDSVRNKAELVVIGSMLTQALAAAVLEKNKKIREAQKSAGIR